MAKDPFQHVTKLLERLRALGASGTGKHTSGSVSVNGSSGSVTQSGTTHAKTVIRDGESTLTLEFDGKSTTITHTSRRGTSVLTVAGGVTVTGFNGGTVAIGDGRNHITVKSDGTLSSTAHTANASTTPPPSLPKASSRGGTASASGVPSASKTQGKPNAPKAISKASAAPRPAITGGKPPEVSTDTPLFPFSAEKETPDALTEEERHILEVTSMELPMDWENLYALDERAAEPAADIADGFVRCLNTLGRVDIEYISAVSGESLRRVIEELAGAIYQNPDTWEECFYRGWETADEYLSGNLLQKYRSAVTANKKYNGYFDANVTVLKRLLPAAIPEGEIYVTIGSPWVPTTVIDDFIEHLTGCKVRHWSEKTNHDEATGLWEIPYKTRYHGTRFAMKDASVYGTLRMGMLTILEHTLNMKTIVIKDKVKSLINKSGEALAINERETVLALEKQSAMLRAFADWVWTDKKRAELLRGIYESRYGAIRRRQFDGSFLTLPGMSEGVSLYPYQKNAVARILLTPNTLLAHDVGSGKTYVMITAGMELRRMGISEKNLYVVPNTLIGQWKAAFALLYPKAKLLTVEPKHFTRERRNAALEEIRCGDYDAALIAYSCFDAIPMSPKYYEAQHEERVRALKKSSTVFRSPTALERRIKAEGRLYEKQKSEMAEGGFTLAFDELGIGTLFVDEAHNYKNVPVDTSITHVLGISPDGSLKCRSMMNKCRWVQRENGGRGVVLATGTPITNSITDVFVMQKYLQSGDLALLGLSSFDSWVGMFAEKATEFEIGVDTGSYRLATRFSRFHNLTELTSILAAVADFHTADKQDGIPDFDGYTDSLLPPSVPFVHYLRDISRRADDVKNRRVRRNEDNMLKITTDGRLAALDLRLVDDNAVAQLVSKAVRCADHVLRIYHETESEKSAQLIFCDTSTPKAGFHMYGEMRRLLTEGGIPDTAIAYIHDATTEKKRNALFAAVREGRIRVLIGSTFKLGLGVNVQERLIAVHHLDVPWRPADMVQREGRILRQGNTSERVYIYRYITEGSFDAYSWQLLETKQRFISQLLSGSLSERTGGDIDSTVLGYAEIKALAIGNPRVKRRVELSNELSRLYLLQRDLVEGRERMRVELAECLVTAKRLRERINACRADVAFLEEPMEAPSQEEEREWRERLAGALRANIENPVETEVFTYRGFRVLIPAYMRAERPSLILLREGRYRVEIGAEGGAYRRIDLFLSELSSHLSALRAEHRAVSARKKSLEEELSREVGYTAEIEEKRAAIAEIDKELGVK